MSVGGPGVGPALLRYGGFLLFLQKFANTHVGSSEKSGKRACVREVGKLKGRRRRSLKGRLCELKFLSCYLLLAIAIIIIIIMILL